MSDKKSQRVQAPHSLRHNWAAAGRGGALDWHSRPGRSQGFAIRLFLYFESLKTIFVDGSYSCSLINWALSMLGWNMQVIKRCQQRVFRVLPKRWVVQRTFAWLSQSRRMSKDYEVSVASAEAFIKIACIRRMVRPLR